MQDGVRCRAQGARLSAAAASGPGSSCPSGVDFPGRSSERHITGSRAGRHRTVHAFSRPGRELIRLPGLAWLREIRRPIASAVLDGEAVAGDGSEGIQPVFEARHRPGSPMAFAAFDVLELDGLTVVAKPWTARRKRLEDLLEAPAKVVEPFPTIACFEHRVAGPG